jgi:2-hydroxy-3-keto-5-methylthiopentenyl-1-phosphate phosphatase
MPTAYLCDFDGTIAPSDIGAALFQRFAVGDRSEPAAALARWKEDAIGSRELTEIECRCMEVAADEALAFSRSHTIDARFPDFVRAARARGDVVMVASEGYDFYVADQLARAGLADVPWRANHARFEDRRMIPEFPWADPSCSRCGNCKAQYVRDHRARGYRVVFVGDGLSDRCGARVADAVFARASLWDWCLREGVIARPFVDFGALTETEAA